ncbi:MAG: hypothetical protein HQL95_11430 [Magnetococcales bacterium]|nr:hypothetical protein [Magnetococcales bacterium]
MKTVLEEMLAEIEQKRCSEQTRILSHAREEAAVLIAAAHRQARGRMREFVARERRLLEAAMKSAQTREETERRNHAMSVVRRTLEQARVLLEAALRERWNDPDSRGEWIGKLLERALEFLPAGEWEMVHPARWEASERDAFLLRIQAAGLPAPRVRPEEGLVAGLRLGCQGAWVDGSIPGLTANRSAIDAALLALLQRQGASS